MSIGIGCCAGIGLLLLGFVIKKPALLSIGLLIVGFWVLLTYLLLGGLRG